MSRIRRAETRLIVAVDADRYTVAERLEQLSAALHEAGLDELGRDDLAKIARLVPKRNVETWILSLSGGAMDEETDYKNAHEEWGELIPAAGGKLYEWTRRNAVIPLGCVDSLAAGVAELQRTQLV